MLEAVLTDARRGIVRETKRRTPGVREARSMMRRRLIPEFNDTPLEGITLKQVNALRSKLLAEGRLKPGSIQKLMGVNYGVLKHAVRMEWIPTSPAEHYERVKLEDSGDFNMARPRRSSHWPGRPPPSRKRLSTSSPPSPAYAKASSARCVGRTWSSPRRRCARGTTSPPTRRR